MLNGSELDFGSCKSSSVAGEAMTAVYPNTDTIKIVSFLDLERVAAEKMLCYLYIKFFNPKDRGAERGSEIILSTKATIFFLSALQCKALGADDRT